MMIMMEGAVCCANYDGQDGAPRGGVVYTVYKLSKDKVFEHLKCPACSAVPSRL
jgi:hypothetical protein